MAAGLPIIATDIGDIGRIVKESESGLVTKWDVNEFAEVAEELLTKRNLWLAFHENGLRYVENYDWDKLFSGWLQEIQNRVPKVNSLAFGSS
jgi:glycosyltransferase involved in cell wall biosynthesis